MIATKKSADSLRKFLNLDAIFKGYCTRGGQFRIKLRNKDMFHGHNADIACQVKIRMKFAVVIPCFTVEYP